MFIHNQSNTTIYAPINNTLIESEYTIQETISELLEALKDTPEYVQVIQSIPSYVWENDSAEYWETEAPRLKDELIEVLNSYANEPYEFTEIDNKYGYFLKTGWGLTNEFY